jgi:hypothetical protein
MQFSKRLKWALTGSHHSHYCARSLSLFLRCRRRTVATGHVVNRAAFRAARHVVSVVRPAVLTVTVRRHAASIQA